MSMAPSTAPPRRLSLGWPTDGPWPRRLVGAMAGPLERLLALDRLNDTYDQVLAQQGSRPFFDTVLEALKVRLELADEDLAKIPAAGPVVVVANHPFGAIEGVILDCLLRRVRPDVKILANAVLAHFAEVRDHFIFVDPFGSPGAVRSNIRAMKESVGWLRRGGLLGVFPAGEVAHFDVRRAQITDPPWSPHVAALVRHAKAQVVPVFFKGCNGPLFQVLGLVHPRLRTAMLGWELLRKRGQTVEVRIGSAIPFHKLREFSADGELVNYLRCRTYLLAQRGREAAPEAPPPRRPALFPRPARVAHQPVIAPVSPALMAAELDALPADAVLIRAREHLVIQADAVQVPHLLREIGRLREIAFRETGEGTGQPCDLDRYDNTYQHLFVWNHETRQVIAAYRVGYSDQIVTRYGKRGLYTSSLFQYDDAFLRETGPALELGRSFVRPECQRSYTPLLLLWRGIAALVARQPRYKVLFGPVSISNRYQSISRQWMVRFLRLHNFTADLARWVHARRPFRPPLGALHPAARQVPGAVADIDDLSDCIAEIERDGKGIPVLLRQYLKLGGKLVGFNVDPAFSDVLDGLIWVDLTRTDRHLLARYMGADEVAAFLRHHGR